MALDKLPDPDIQLPASWWFKYRLSRIVGGLLSYVPNFGLHLARLEVLIHRIRRAAHSEYAFRKNRKKVSGTAENAASFGSGYGYEDPKEELRVAKMYKSEIVSGQYANLESPILYTHVEECLASVLAASKIKRVVDFGVCYAYVDSLLAKRFPNVQFTGIDRSPAICELNETEFPLPNMKFVANDIFKWIDEQTDLSDTLFFHMRTAVLLPEHFMEVLYGKLIDKNVAVISSFEPIGLSRQTNSFYFQSREQKPSVIFRDSLFLHNYAGMLSRHGYELTRLEYVKTGHSDPDVRVQSLTAAKPSGSLAT